MKENWFWIGKYLVVIVVALVLGSVLVGLEPFRSTMIGSTRIGAGALVQFIAHSGALALLWALGYRHSHQLRRTGGATAPLAAPVLAFVTLIVVASAYAVLIHFVAPLLSQDVKSVVDWTFIVGMLASALWLLWVLFTDSDALFEALGRIATNRRASSAPREDKVDRPA